MKRILNVLALLCMTALLATVQAASPENLSVEGAYVRALPPTVSNTSAYMKLTNNGNEDLILMSAYSTIAESIGIHITENKDGMMQMRHMMSATVPAGGELLLESGGLHLMIMGLKMPLAAGDMVELNLVFQNEQEVQLSVPVRSILEE